MTIEEYCQQAREDGYGVALVSNESDLIITPYCGSGWTYGDNGMCDDEIGWLEVEERTATTIDGRYLLVKHSGIYEEMYNDQEINDD